MRVIKYISASGLACLYATFEALCVSRLSGADPRHTSTSFSRPRERTHGNQWQHSLPSSTASTRTITWKSTSKKMWPQSIPRLRANQYLVCFFPGDTGGTTDGVCISHTSSVVARVSFVLARSSSAPFVDQYFAPGRSPNTKKTDCTTQLTRAISRTGKYSNACARNVSDSRQKDVLSAREMNSRAWEISMCKSGVLVS